MNSNIIAKLLNNQTKVKIWLRKLNGILKEYLVYRR